MQHLLNSIEEQPTLTVRPDIVWVQVSLIHSSSITRLTLARNNDHLPPSISHVLSQKHPFYLQYTDP